MSEKINEALYQQLCLLADKSKNMTDGMALANTSMAMVSIAQYLRLEINPKEESEY